MFDSAVGGIGTFNAAMLHLFLSLIPVAVTIWIIGYLAKLSGGSPAQRRAKEIEAEIRSDEARWEKQTEVAAEKALDRAVQEGLAWHEQTYKRKDTA